MAGTLGPAGEAGRLPQRTRAYVWDLDETLIVFNSLLNHEFARANPSCPKPEAFALGERWQDAILDFIDDNFFYRQVSPGRGAGRVRAASPNIPRADYPHPPP